MYWGGMPGTEWNIHKVAESTSMKRAQTSGKEKSNIMVREPTWNAENLLQRKGERAQVNSTRTQKKD